MTDYFALFSQPRRPWLDEGLLKAKFLQMSAEVHPDRVHGASETEKQNANERFSELNSAYDCLREPKSRVQHLFELETGTKPKDVQQIPSATMDLFLQIGQLCREVDSFLSQRAQVLSPLVKVEMFERAQEWTDKLNAVQRDLNIRRESLEIELKTMNAAWDSGPPSGEARKAMLPLPRLEQVGREFSYLGRWSAQLQERIVQLAL